MLKLQIGDEYRKNVYLNMETLNIEILNPKAKKLLQELANLQLISIKTKVSEPGFEQLLTRLRTTKATPSLAEITQEVEAVRSKRHGHKAH
jgi:hypothetical protein